VSDISIQEQSLGGAQRLKGKISTEEQSIGSAPPISTRQALLHYYRRKMAE